MMEGEPETILSDEQLSIRSALRKIKSDGEFSGYHLHDNFHLLHNFKKKMKNKNVFQLCRKALLTTSRVEFKKVMA